MYSWQLYILSVRFLLQPRGTWRQNLPGKLDLTRMDLTPSRFGGKGTRACHWSGDYQTIILEPDWFKRSRKRTQYNVLTLKIGAKVGRYKRGCGARLSHLHRSIAARRLSLPPKHCRQPPTL